MGVGALAAGALLQAGSWRWAFLPGLVAAAMGLVGAWGAEDSRSAVPRHLDWPGQILGTLAVCGLVYGVIEGADSGWSGPRSVLGFAFAVGGAVLFVVTESRSTSPMLDLTVFRARAFTGASVVAIIAMFGLIVPMGCVTSWSLVVSCSAGSGSAGNDDVLDAVVADRSAGPVSVGVLDAETGRFKTAREAIQRPEDQRLTRAGSPGAGVLGDGAMGLDDPPGGVFVNLEKFLPSRELATVGVRVGPQGVLRYPALPGAVPYIAALEGQPTTGAQGVVGMPENLGPRLVGGEVLRDVLGHDRQVCAALPNVAGIPVDPGDLVTPQAASGNIKHR